MLSPVFKVTNFLNISLVSIDDRFPSDATVEFVFSSGPEKIKGILVTFEFCKSFMFFYNKNIIAIF